MKKTNLILMSLCIGAIISVNASAMRVPDNRRVEPGEKPHPKPPVEHNQVSLDFPSVWDWKQILSRVNANYQYNSSKGVGDQWWFETTQPFYTLPDTYSSTVLGQFRAMFQKNIQTYNMGLGYRYLMNNDRYMFGVNGFYDVQSNAALQRWSLGADIHTEWLTIWGNYYGKVLKWRTVGRTTGTVSLDRGLSGGDFNATAPFPYLPWLRIQGGFYVWDYFEGQSNATGYKIALRANVWGPLTIEGGRTADRYTKNNFVLASLNLGSPNFMQYTLWNTPYSKKILPARTLKRFILDPIQRINQIRLQGKTTTTGGVLIRRSN